MRLFSTKKFNSIKVDGMEDWMSSTFNNSRMSPTPNEWWYILYSQLHWNSVRRLKKRERGKEGVRERRWDGGSKGVREGGSKGVREEVRVWWKEGGRKYKGVREEVREGVREGGRQPLRWSNKWWEQLTASLSVGPSAPWCPRVVVLHKLNLPSGRI